MKLTEAMKKWLVEHCDVKADASDDEFRKAAGTAIALGTLTMEKFAELQSEKDDKEANEFKDKLDQIVGGLGKLSEAVSTKTDTTEEPKKATKLDKMVAEQGGTPEEPDREVRVKGAWEQYSTTKSALTFPSHDKKGRKHPFAGRPVMDYSQRGKPIDQPSDLDMAICGAYAKFMIHTARRGGSRMLGYQALTDHEKGLLHHALDTYEWGGSTDGGNEADIRGKLSPSMRKDLIDDATSGGVEAAPIVFDDQVIQTPLLHGELFPLVNVVPLDRGRRVEGVETATVTGGWNGVDATAISLFNTASYVSAFDTTVYRWEGAFRIGLDFLSDTPIDFGAHVTAQYGERLLEDLDDVIAVGNGTTQPEGVQNKTGITTVAWGGATSLGNYETLRFGVAKAEHRPNLMATAVFCGTETSYQRARALPVGASDARRLFGMDYDSYSIMERPYKINESLANTQIWYAILARYRMYRRRGLTIRTSTEGDTLIRNNELLIAVTARFGGQLERGAAGATTGTSAPA